MSGTKVTFGADGPHGYEMSSYVKSKRAWPGILWFILCFLSRPGLRQCCVTYPHAGFMILITSISLIPGMASLGMQYHKLTEHFDEKPFSCEECGAKFAANSTLKNHLRLHTGDRPFMCKHCLMTFTQASALAYHTKKKHSEGKTWGISSFLPQT